MSIRILIADDHEVMRQGLHALLFRQPDFDVVACVADGLKALEAARFTRPDVVLMDIRMPEMDGVQATRQLLRNMPDVKVLCLSIHRSGACIRAALANGASGYLVKDCAVEEIVDAIHVVHRGECYISPEVKKLIEPTCPPCP